LDALTQEVTLVAEKIDETADISEKQGILTNDTNEEFVKIQDKMESLDKEIQEVQTLMAQMVESNNQIVESIDTLAASSEEVTASSEEALSISQTNVDEVKNFIVKMEQTLEVIRKLASYTV
jgi:methyl-accepting chemotaxis protein